MKKKMDNKGFSLVELIIVIAIMVILVAVLAIVGIAVLVVVLIVVGHNSFLLLVFSYRSSMSGTFLKYSYEFSSAGKLYFAPSSSFFLPEKLSMQPIPK